MTAPEVVLELVVVSGRLRVAGYDRTVRGAVRGSPDILHYSPGDTVVLTLDARHDAVLTVDDRHDAPVDTPPASA